MSTSKPSSNVLNRLLMGPRTFCRLGVGCSNASGGLDRLIPVGWVGVASLAESGRGRLLWGGFMLRLDAMQC